MPFPGSSRHEPEATDALTVLKVEDDVKPTT
jgi:hypothetical protein